MIFEKVLRWLMAKAMRRGLLGRSRFWLVVLVAVGGGRVIRFLIDRKKGSLSIREHLEVGDRLEIGSFAPPGSGS